MGLPDHLGGHMGVTHTDAAVLDFLCATFPPITSMIDVGCGPGGMHNLAYARGIDWHGVDGDPSVARFNDRIQIHDYTAGALLHPPVSLAWSVEFVEHVAPAYIGNYVATFNAARILYMTHALPGQPGYHHVNCQPPHYWIDTLATYGWYHMAAASARARAVAVDIYTRQSGLIFTRERLL